MLGQQPNRMTRRGSTCNQKKIISNEIRIGFPGRLLMRCLHARKCRWGKCLEWERRWLCALLIWDTWLLQTNQNLNPTTVHESCVKMSVCACTRARACVFTPNRIRERITDKWLNSGLAHGSCCEENSALIFGACFRRHKLMINCLQSEFKHLV